MTDAEPDIEAIAHDYETLTAFEFDAKYPGWYTDPRVLNGLTNWFRAKEGLEPITLYPE